MVDPEGGATRTGTRFGQYQLGRLLGAGGFGEVYQAEDTVMGRQVALKLLAAPYSQDRVFRERLFREAQTAGRLNEPHIVPIHGCGEIDGQLYIDMRLIAGTDLATVLAHNGPLAPPRAVSIVRQIAAALDAAHHAGMIHRDIKPSNILLTADDFAYLVDFGLANAATDTKLTNTGTTIGTFGYMAPERLTHNADVGASSDVYALACVLYECLTGSAPYHGGDMPMLISAHLNAPIPRASQGRAWLPAALDEVIAHGMAKDPAGRYRSAGDLGRAAEQALRTPVPGAVAQAAFAPTQAAPLAHTRATSRRRIVAMTLVALVAVAGVAIAAWAGIRLAHRPPPGPTTTLAQPCLDAQQAADDLAVLLTSIDANRYDEDTAVILAHSTGDFKEQYAKSSAQLRQVLIDNGASAHGTVAESAIQSCTDTKAAVLLFVDQSISNKATPDPRVDRSRIKIIMELVDNHWLASEVRIV